jgi:phage shock protein C
VSITDTRTQPPVRRFYRSRRERMIAGVCGGLAEYLAMDPTVVRLLYIALSIFSAGFPGILVYIILALVVPPNPEP